jgi:hypothetical protein
MALMTMSGLSTPASAQVTDACGDETASGVYLYSDINFSGTCSFFTGNSANAATWNIGDNSASAIKIIGTCTATLFNQKNFHSRLQTFTADDSNFTDDDNSKRLNDKTSSIRVSCDT